MNIKNLKKIILKTVFLFLIVFVLNSCVTNKVIPPCPGIYLEKDTVSAVLFKDDVGKDITDKILEVEIAGYNGQCKFSKDFKTVEVSLNVFFDATLGGASTSQEVDFDYFIAVPSFYPHEEGKKVFNVRLNFPQGIYYLKHRDDEVKITLPMPQSEDSKDLSIFIGIQLNENQLEYNRKINQAK